jgi:hypothetical protein
VRFEIKIFSSAFFNNALAFYWRRSCKFKVVILAPVLNKCGSIILCRKLHIAFVYNISVPSFMRAVGVSENLQTCSVHGEKVGKIIWRNDLKLG